MESIEIYFKLPPEMERLRDGIRTMITAALSSSPFDFQAPIQVMLNFPPKE